MKTNLGKKEYFEELFSKSFEDDPWGHNWRASVQYRYRQCLKLLNRFRDKNLRVLDIGCSLGDFTVQIKEALKPKEIWAVDISEEAIRKAKTKYKNSKINFEVSSLPSLERFQDNSFDLVLASEVLCYLGKEDRIKASKEIKRVLQKDDFLLISVTINKPPYFQIDEIYNLISQFFKIKRVKYSYGKVYSFFERKLLILDRAPLKKFIRCFLSIKIFVIIGQFLTKLILSKKGITNMYILAQKKKS